jgi:thiol-disulfide isomerase/thioredoxin
MRRQPIFYLILALALAIPVLWLGQSQGYAPGQPAPEFTNETWINSEPLRLTELKGKVVLVEFWTFGCYNCQNVEPYVKNWHDKFRDHGLVVIGYTRRSSAMSVFSRMFATMCTNTASNTQ